MYVGERPICGGNICGERGCRETSSHRVQPFLRKMIYYLGHQVYVFIHAQHLQPAQSNFALLSEFDLMNFQPRSKAAQTCRRDRSRKQIKNKNLDFSVLDKTPVTWTKVLQ